MNLFFFNLSSPFFFFFPPQGFINSIHNPHGMNCKCNHQHKERLKSSEVLGSATLANKGCIVQGAESRAKGFVALWESADHTLNRW